MFECRAVLKGEWKLIFMAPPYGDNDWQLFNLADDPRELANLAADHPEKFAEMKAEWEAYAMSVGYIQAGKVKQLDCMPAEEFFQYAGLA